MAFFSSRIKRKEENIEKTLIGFVDLVDFNGLVYPFLIYDDCTMDCVSLGIEGIKKLYLKPRFEVETEDACYTLSSQLRNDRLISQIICDDNMFDYLYQNKMIYFSTDMAYLYDLPIKEGFDFRRKKECENSGTPYKWAEKKGPILARQKAGKFN